MSSASGCQNQIVLDHAAIHDRGNASVLAAVARWNDGSAWVPPLQGIGPFAEVIPDARSSLPSASSNRLRGPRGVVVRAVRAMKALDSSGRRQDY